MILPATGKAAEKGKPGGDAVKDAMEYVNNELNGAGGYKVQISWRDSNYDPAVVTTIMKDFQTEGDVLFTTMSSAEMSGSSGYCQSGSFPWYCYFCRAE